MTKFDPPGPRKNRFLCGKVAIFQKIRSSRAVAGAPPGAPGGAPGEPREGDIDQLFDPRGHQEAPNAFVVAPGPPPGRHQDRFEGLLAAHMAPRGAPEASRPSFGALRAPLGEHFSLNCCHVSTLVSHSLRVMFSFLFAGVLVLVLCFSRLRSLNFEIMNSRCPMHLYPKDA